MNIKSYLTCAAMAVLLGAATACSDDDKTWPTVDGNAPALTLESNLVAGRIGQTFHVKGKVEDADGIASIALQCPALFLDKTIDIIGIYGKPLNSYDLDYEVITGDYETGDKFTVEVTVTDVAGKTATDRVVVDMDGDIEAPVFAVAPDNDIYVVLDGKAVLPLSFTVRDDRSLARVKVDVDGAGYSHEVTEFADSREYVFSEEIALPAVADTYTMTVSAADTWGNEISKVSSIHVTDTPDYPKMWLADVATAAELNSDVMGVPMLIEHTGTFRYEARYYNAKAGTAVWFLPQRTDFAPVRFGLDADGRISKDGASAIVLDQAGMYYHFTFDIATGEYSAETYSPADAVDPVPHAFGSVEMDRYENGKEKVEFWFGYTTSGPGGITRFEQDADNPHLYYLPEPLSLKAGRHSGFIIHNYHPDGWWNYCTWRADDEQDPETADWYGNFTNPAWKGKRGADYWFKPLIPADGLYDLIFDAHLGRMRIIPAK